jgi:hypothetical protein
MWIVEGYALLRKSPGIWILIVLILYVLLGLLVRIPLLGPLLGILFMLLVPAFLAGLMQGCRDLDAGGKLSALYLLSGFQRNTVHLVTLGGMSLVANLLLVMLFITLTGDAVTAIMKQASTGKIDPAVAQAAAPRIMTATVVVSILSLPVLMGLWFAPMLVYFDNLRPVRSLVVSCWACGKNALPFLVYGGVVMLAVMVLTPFMVGLGRIDLVIWVLAPVLVPSIYASYKDIFVAAGSPASSAGGNPPVTT